MKIRLPTLLLTLLILTTPCYAGGIAPDKQKEAGAHARGEGNDSTAPTASAPTLTRRGRGGAPASISSVS